MCVRFFIGELHGLRFGRASIIYSLRLRTAGIHRTIGTLKCIGSALLSKTSNPIIQGMPSSPIVSLSFQRYVHVSITINVCSLPLAICYTDTQVSPYTPPYSNFHMPRRELRRTTGPVSCTIVFQLEPSQKIRLVSLSVSMVKPCNPDVEYMSSVRLHDKTIIHSKTRLSFSADIFVFLRAHIEPSSRAAS
jgi:hypothetical protein